MGTELICFHGANTMVANALAPCIARTSVPIILWRISMFLSYLGKDFNYLCHINMEKWHKMYLYVFVSSEKFSMQRMNEYLFHRSFQISTSLSKGLTLNRLKCFKDYERYSYILNSYLGFCLTHIDEIKSGTTINVICPTQSIPCLLMYWRL